jgi:S-disulfanyl-L-cysteine oxidoreductase SoxD
MARSRIRTPEAGGAFLVITMALALAGCATRATTPATSAPLGIGRAPTQEELVTLAVFSVRPDGRGLPAGRGTAVEGRAVYAAKCAACHGATGREGGMTGNRPTPGLVEPRPFKAGGPIPATVGNYWPYATTIWDYTHRSMPFDRPGSLTYDEVYAVTAYLLHANGLITERDVIDAQSLPKIRMPNRDNFVSPDPRPDVR